MDEKLVETDAERLCPFKWWDDPRRFAWIAGYNVAQRNVLTALMPTLATLTKDTSQ